MTILLNWDYHRLDLTEYLLDFSDEVNLVFLFDFQATEVPDYMKKNISKVLYWSNFKSPYQLLRSVRPDKVVFNDIEAFNQLALNIAAKNSGIPTYVLQHGLRGDFEIRDALSISKLQPVTFSHTSKWSLQFFLRSLQLKNSRWLPSIVKFLYQRKKLDLTTALFKNQFALREADLYIEFSEENKGYFQTRDGVKDQKFLLTGNPTLDQYLVYFNSHLPPGPAAGYFLLIDCPFSDTALLDGKKMSLADKNSYLNKLNTIAQYNGKRLVVKLHPLTYHSEGLLNDENIQYLTQVDVKPWLAGAAGVFFVHFSSMTPAILPFKPSIYFDVGFKEHTVLFSKLSVTIYHLASVEASEIKVGDSNLVDEASLIRFLYKTDGKAAQRIKEILCKDMSSYEVY